MLDLDTSTITFGGGSGKHLPRSLLRSPRRVVLSAKNGSPYCASCCASAMTSNAGQGSSRAKSCRECIRLKLKCSRAPWPCDKCVQRGTADLCPAGELPTRPYRSGRSSLANDSVGHHAAQPSKKRRTDDTGTDEVVISDSDDHVPLNQPSNTTGIATPPPSRPVESRATAPRRTGEHHVATSSMRIEEALTEHGSLHLGTEGRATRYIGPGGHSFSLAGVNDASPGSNEDDLTRPASPAVCDGRNGPTRPVAAFDATPSYLIGDSPSFQQTDALLLLAAQPAALVPTPGVRDPFSHARVSEAMLRNLPSAARARRAFHVYIWNVTWMYDPIHRLDQLWKDFYPASELGISDGIRFAAQGQAHAPAERGSPAHTTTGHSLHRLALLLSVLALGHLFDTRPPTADQSSAEYYYQCAWASLSLANLNNRSSIESVQTIHLLGQYLCNRKNGRHADSFYPLLGYAMRSSIAMGLHRDVPAWNLPKSTVEERRRLYWEFHASDAFRALAYGRPCNIRDRYTNAQFPEQRSTSIPFDAFHTSKFHVVRLLNRIIDETYGQSEVDYATILAFDKELRQLSATKVPFDIGTQVWSTSQRVAFDSVADRLDDTGALHRMQTQFQAHTIAVNIHQVFLHLHRPWFVKALRSSGDVFESPHLRSVIAVSESSRTLISIGVSIHQKARNLAGLWNFFSQHVFNAAICSCLHLLFSPHDVTTASSWEDIDRALTLLRTVRSDKTDPIWSSKLELLERLRGQVSLRLSSAADLANVGLDATPTDRDLHLVGATTTIDRRAEATRGVREGNEGTAGAQGDASSAGACPAPSNDAAHANATEAQEQDSSVQRNALPDNVFDIDAFTSLLDNASYEGGVSLAELLLDGSAHDVRFWDGASGFLS